MGKDENGNGMSKLKSAAAIVTALGVIGGGVLFVEDRYAKSQDLKDQEVKTIKTLEKYNKVLDLRFQQNRQQYLNDKVKRLEIESQSRSITKSRAIDNKKELDEAVKQKKDTDNKVDEITKDLATGK